MKHWKEAGWEASAREWVASQLAGMGGEIIGESETVHVRDWSIVVRFASDTGTIYFKAGASTQHFEAGLLEAIGRAESDLLLAPLAIDAERGWMLLPEGGPRLREFHGGNPAKGDWEMLLARYAEAQIDLSKHAQDMLEAGLPDRRLGRLPGEYKELLSSPSLAEITELGGLRAEEMRRLIAKKEEFSAMIAELKGIGIAPSVEHGDLHDGNVFYDGSSLRVFDWGDASLSHPFISLIIPLRVLGNYLSLEPESHPELEWARRAYFGPWEQAYSPKQVKEAWPLALQVGYFQRALTWYKTAQLESEDSASHAEAFVAWLRDYLYYPELAPEE